MERRKQKEVLLPRYIFCLCVAAVLLYLILGQMLLPNESGVDYADGRRLDVAWVRVQPDQTRENIVLPAKLDAAKGETVVIEATLPQIIKDNANISIASVRQNIDIFIDGELRYHFDTKDSRLFGKYNAFAYIFMTVNKTDAGKILRIESTSESKYAGWLSEVYFGEKMDIWKVYVRQYGPRVVIAIFLLVFAVIIITFSLAIRFSFKKSIALEYLGWCALLIASWMICESRLRQLYFPNFSVASDVAFFSGSLLPFPLLNYVNSIQGARYVKYFSVLKWIIAAGSLLCSILHITRVVDFADSMSFLYFALFAAILLVGVTSAIDVFHKKKRGYWLVLAGYCVLFVGSMHEVTQVYLERNRNTGILFAAVMLFVLALVKTGKDVSNMEKEKRTAISLSQAQNNFLANMSHEIRTPINTIIGMNEMILRESREFSVLEYAQNTANASRMLLALVNDILDFSKMESGNMEIVKKSYHLASLLNDEMQTIEEKARKKNLQVILSIDENLPSNLIGDEVRIKQVLTNLLTNSVKYTQSGSVTLSVYGEWAGSEQFSLKMCVQDTGVGMREEDLQQLFTRFTRFDRQKNSTIEGTGLGLAITKRLVDLMQGEIQVESRYGEGTSFTVTIPQEITSGATFGVQQVSRQETSTRKPYEESFHAPDARVLIVDDNKMNLAVAKGLLKRTEMQVDTAISGQKCLEITREKKYHVILMDHMMPEMDGIETFHHLKEEKNNPNQNTPVIALTANAIAGIRDEYIREGFADYISKPIDASQLESMLLTYLPEDVVQKKIKSGEES